MFNIWETLTGVALSAEQRINDGMIDIDGLTMDEKVLVYADPDLIHQVAYNLLDNAIKFTPAGGTIRFGVERLGPEVEVSIWNSGQGISCKNHCICPPGTQRKCTIRRSVPGSNAFVPSVVGLIIGGEVVKDLVGFVPMKG